MKKVTLLCALMLSWGNASDSVKESITQEEKKKVSKSDWEETFLLVDGKTSVKHSSERVTFDHHFSPKSIQMKGKTYKGMPLKGETIVLSVEMSRDEFVKALVEATLYKKENTDSLKKMTE